MLIPLKKASLAIALAACLTALGSAPVHAVPNALDNKPAATLLFPYFEVDLNSATGMTTLFALQNTYATALLVNVTLWSDHGIPVYNFPVYLTGYDVQAINLRDILNGTLPMTASDGQDPGDTSNPNDGISNQGPSSQDINFASCNGILPPAALDSTAQTALRNALTGQTIGGGQCVGNNYGDNVARGYITADTVNHCNAGTPDTPGYSTSITYQNSLVGDWFLVNQNENFMQADAAVAVEAVLPVPDFVPDNYVAGDQSFYGRLNAWTGVDDREPLPTTWAMQAINYHGSVHVWRDTKRTPAAFACGGLQSTLSVESSGMFGMDSESYLTTAASSPAPWAAQRVDYDQATFALPAVKTGWHYLSLQHNDGNVAGLSGDPTAAQSFVTVVRHSQGRFSHGASAMPMDSAVEPIQWHPNFPAP
jgi:hypothetical protein